MTFHFIYGMSSFPLTYSIIFQDGLTLHHQPVKIMVSFFVDYCILIWIIYRWIISIIS